jgi:predicted Co/Zn/Cd cation transporter (cation efflux family)
MIRVDPSVHQHVAIGKPVKHTAIQRWIITGVISIGILVAFVIAHIVLLTLKA